MKKHISFMIAVVFAFCLLAVFIRMAQRIKICLEENVEAVRSS